MQTPDFDVVIIGGSYAGLSAAMALGRAVRRVLVLDSGQPCNRQTPHSHNLITQDGATPAHITAVAKEQVLAYPTVCFQTGTVTAVTGETNAFVVETAVGERFRARKLLFATGVRDLLPAIPGFAESWGISTIHCPYCHGYEYRDQPTGILVNGPTALDFGKLIHNWTRQLTLFTNGPATLDAGQHRQLQTLGIGVVETEVTQLHHTGGMLDSLQLADGTRHPLRVLYARVPFEQSTPLPEALGCALTETGLLQVDAFGHTSVPGVFAAGDNCTWLRSVAGAIAMGTVAGGFLNHELIAESV